MVLCAMAEAGIPLVNAEPSSFCHGCLRHWSPGRAPDNAALTNNSLTRNVTPPDRTPSSSICYLQAGSGLASSAHTNGACGLRGAIGRRAASCCAGSDNPARKPVLILLRFVLGRMQGQDMPPPRVMVFAESEAQAAAMQ